MDNKSSLKEIGIFLFNRVGEIKRGDDIRPQIYDVLSYGKSLPAFAYDLIPDERYHKNFDIIYGYMWYLRKLEEPPFDVYFALLTQIASELKLPFIGVKDYRNLLFHTLLVEYFETD